ncbi:hypothetical protein [Streptomonospora wellingtoniae]|uniref:Flp family type IVb pilin n=1 Tax=Streptomonospora wellingtoniae TaxID=3075544 RepID=A0ABU2KWF1_9ACTN|nr:hypothetical protein [Streptomonospora sp. DSM 45055]MDT0303620.1 hypothetical protein [Streptomonospora sp. DSM 45055]
MNYLRRLLDPRRLRGRGDGGYSTETVLVIAVLALMAVTAVGAISAQVIEKAESFSLD